MFTNLWDCPSYNLQASFNHDNLRSSPRSITIATQAFLVHYWLALDQEARHWPIGIAPVDVMAGIQNSKRQLGLRRRGERTPSDCCILLRIPLCPHLFNDKQLSITRRRRLRHVTPLQLWTISNYCSPI